MLNLHPRAARPLVMRAIVMFLILASETSDEQSVTLSMKSNPCNCVRREQEKKNQSERSLDAKQHSHIRAKVLRSQYQAKHIQTPPTVP
jgi:hypothetical protein